MTVTHRGLLLMLACAVCAGSLSAYEQGDFAPRGSLLYARVADVSDAAKRLAGEDWKAQVERMLLLRDKRDFEESEPLVNEIRRFVDYLGAMEQVIADIMIREPYAQSAQIIHLKEGAPKTFSEEFRAWLKEQNRDWEVTETAITFEGGRFWLKGDLLIASQGGMMDVHIQDVLDGYTDESLSKVERFTKWSAKAKGDIVVFADMKAWRAGLDRFGEDFDQDIREALDIIEWQKWDLITGTIGLPGKTNGLTIDLSLSLNQPFEHVNAFLKPSGGSRLVNVLPAECAGFLTAQLGREHEATYTSLMQFFHDFEQNQHPSRLRQRIEWREYEVKDMEAHITRLKEAIKERDKDKDALEDALPQNAARRVYSNTPKEPVGDGGSDEEDMERDLDEELKNAEEQLNRTKTELTELRAQLENFRYRPFQPDSEQRKDRGTEAEQFHDELGEILGQFGFTRQEVLETVGNEALAGILNMPDPGFADDSLDNAFEDQWFVLVETAESWPQVKEKFLDRFLARNIPEDMDPERAEDLKRNAEKMLLKKVEGGEILLENGLSSTWCAFGGEGFVGMSANEDVALCILKANTGQGRLSVSSIPGGSVSGSKFAWVNLGAVLGKIARGDMMRRRRDMGFPDPYFDLEKYLPGGFQISASTDEGSHAVSISARTGGETSAAGAMKMFADEILNSIAYRHDRDMLNDLQRALNQWRGDNQEAFKELGDSERAKLLKSVTPESLFAAGFPEDIDGLRSAFDPAMAQRWAAALDAHTRVIGPVKDKPDDLSESSYEWFGLPPDLQYSDERGWHRADEKNPHIICQMKGDWARDGRLCVFWSGEPRVRWLTAEDLAKLRQSITNGTEWKPADADDQPMPRWRARRLVARKVYEMRDLCGYIQAARDRAATEGKEFKLDFKGADGDKPAERLRQLLGLTEEEWFYFQDAGNLTLKTDDEGKVTAKFEKWGQWIEITEKAPETEFELPYELKTSLDGE